ncbi:MAG: DUF5131 family protein [Dysgonomonas sp.]
MALNTQKGNMYDFVTHTWNTVKGKCPHDCGYCYMKRWGHLKEPRFDSSELKTDLGADNFIFVGSSNDLFADQHPDEWIVKTLDYCESFVDNKYLFQSKNPSRILDYIQHPVFKKAVVCTTMETNRIYPVAMNNSSNAYVRAEAMRKITAFVSTYVTIEPIMDFDLDEFYPLIKKCNPEQVNIGADSGHNNLIEPTAKKVLDLISSLEKVTKVNQKFNLKRILQ